MKKIRESKEKLGNLRETGEKIKVGWVQGFGSFLKIRESCPLIRGGECHMAFIPLILIL